LVSGFYRRHISPYVVNAVCSFPKLTEQRELVVPQAEGVVVEIGIGTGLNLVHYDPERVRHVIGVNPSDGLTSLVDFSRLHGDISGELVEESAEAMSLESGTADTIVVTYTMCSIPDIAAAVSEMRRVLKPGGRLLFCEHGRADDPRTARWQDRLNPIWRSMAQGCHLNRRPGELLEEGGFTLEDAHRYPLVGVPSIIGFHHIGTARPR